MKDTIFSDMYSANTRPFSVKNVLLCCLLVVLACGLPSILSAQPLKLPEQQTKALQNPGSEIPEATQKAIIARLKKARPELNFTDLRPSPMKGVYEIKINGQLAFVSEDGGYMIAGEMYEVQENNLVNLQERQRQEAELAFAPQRAKLIADIKKQDMVIYTPKGEVKGHVTIFTDIDCGFCRRLHSQIEAYNAKGIEVRYLAFPRAGIRSRSAQKLATVWCSDNPNEMMTRFKRGEDVSLAACNNNPVADHYMLGQQVGVNGTPAIVLESGRIIPGAVSPDFLAQEMGI